MKHLPAGSGRVQVLFLNAADLQIRGHLRFLLAGKIKKTIRACPDKSGGQ